MTPEEQVEDTVARDMNRNERELVAPYADADLLSFAITPDNAEVYLHLVIAEHLKTLAARRSCLLGPLVDTRFLVWPASEKHHHNFRRGLVMHTAEVVQNCLRMCGPSVDTETLIVAAIWHDFAKVYEYQSAILENESFFIKRTYYGRTVGHIVGSAEAFMASVQGYECSYPGFAYDVQHCILAHHGRKEWGSPVEPATIEAHILHAADMLSANPLHGWAEAV